MMEFRLWDTGKVLLITPQAIQMATETEHREPGRALALDRPLQKTVTILTSHGEIVVLDSDRTVMAQIKAGDGARLDLALSRAEIDLKYERDLRKEAEASVAPLHATVDVLAAENAQLKEQLHRILATDEGIILLEEARRAAAAWKRAAKLRYVRPAHRIFPKEG
jgi:hypothetical protein